MAKYNRRHNIFNNDTINASGNSGALPNLSRSNNPTLVCLLDVKNAPSGTSPTLNVSIVGWTDEGRPVSLATFTQVTGQLTAPQRIVVHDVLEDTIEAIWTIGGSNSPTFTGVNLDILMTSPDA
jgi:hypothetical protein